VKNITVKKDIFESISDVINSENVTQDPLPEPSLAEIMAGFSKKNKDTSDENKTFKKKKNEKEVENSLKEAFSTKQIEIEKEKETEKEVKIELKEEKKEEKKEVEKAVESSDDDDDDDDVVYTGKIIIIPKKQK
jgi:hypothetical protein